MKVIEVTIKGISPLLQHRYPIEEHGHEEKKTKKKVYVPEEEAETSCYRGSDGFIYQPSEHIFGALIKAATGFTFQGKKTYKDVIKGGVIIDPEMILLGPGEKKTWSSIDARRVVIGQAAAG